ncbi:hypothetical protein BJ742DRAFT_908137 [Cladochytrium replicatum]|nr:hypothetical protein BJ742DRAFT_908137 [Cladochytrium replicatum]
MHAVTESSLDAGTMTAYVNDRHLSATTGDSQHDYVAVTPTSETCFHKFIKSLEKQKVPSKSNWREYGHHVLKHGHRFGRHAPESIGTPIQRYPLHETAIVPRASDPASRRNSARSRTLLFADVRRAAIKVRDKKKQQETLELRFFKAHGIAWPLGALASAFVQRAPCACDDFERFGSAFVRGYGAQEDDDLADADIPAKI